jgi:hypothetical protein
VTRLMAGYIPFLDPINAFHVWWYLLLVPLSFGISVIYKALKMRNLDRFWQAVTMMTVQIVLAMVALAVVLVVLVQIVIPRLPVQ